MISEVDSAAPISPLSACHPDCHHHKPPDDDISDTKFTSKVSQSKARLSDSSRQQHDKEPKNSNPSSGRRKKRFEETIIDGFTITSFRTWEDLQDELNERITLNLDITRNQDDISISKNTTLLASPDKDSQSCSSTTTTTTTMTTTKRLKTADDDVPDQGKRSTGESTKRLNSSAREAAIREALEAKERAERRLAELQEKLKEQEARRKDEEKNRKGTGSHQSKLKEKVHHSNSHMQNSISGKDLTRDPIPVDPSGFGQPHIQFNKPLSGSHDHHHCAQPKVFNEPRDYLTSSRPYNQSSRISPPPPPPPPSIPQSRSLYDTHPYDQPTFGFPELHKQTYHQYLSQSTIPTSSTYNHQQQSTSSTISAIGSLPSLYNYPCIITDTTISRQTSIIPQPPTPSSLDHIASRIGTSHHSNFMNHSLNLYNQTAIGSHSSTYPPTPTERSFLEYARQFAGANYSGIMGSLQAPTQSSGLTPANPFGSFNRWPRMALDQQRGGYNVQPPGAPTALDRTSSQFATSFRPPGFPIGLYPPF